MSDHEQAGYDAFVETMLRVGGEPHFTDGCDAIRATGWAPGDDRRKAWVRGWLKARDEV